MMDRAYRGSRSDGQMRTILPFAAALAAVSFFQAAAPASAAVRAAPAVTAPQPDHRTISRLVDEAFDQQPTVGRFRTETPGSAIAGHAYLPEHQACRRINPAAVEHELAGLVVLAAELARIAPPGVKR